MTVVNTQYAGLENLFEEVDKNNPEQVMRFRNIVDKAWKAKGFEVTYSEEGRKYILKNAEGIDTGTFQVSLYKNDKSNECDRIFNFGKLEEIKDNIGLVIEIDKFSLNEDGQFKNTERLLYALYLIAKLNNIKYGVALFEPRLPLLFKRRNIPFRAFIEHKQEFEGAPVIPGYIDFERMYNNSDKVKGLKEIEAALAIKEIVNS